MLDSRNEKTAHGHEHDRAFLFSHLKQPGTILLESSKQDPHNSNHFLFHSPMEVLAAYRLDDIPELFRLLEQHRKLSRWIAGYAAYESGYHFDSILPSYSHSGELPLMWFGVYAEPITIQIRAFDELITTDQTAVIDPVLSLGEKAYHNAIDHIKQYILNGDTYQVNFTSRFKFTCNGDPRDLYLALRRKQHVPFSAYLNLGTAQVLSFSPELFFRRNGDVITTKPMKGTCPRGKNAEEDRALSDWLSNDEKNRSENLMIVDLLRNDIGRICEHGSVNVSDMFSVERYETVLQMTSTVSGTLRKDVSYYDIFKALFPCGSVTGAPKIRTMQIIHETEKHPRGIYCGAIGFIAPDERSVFNVAIRTITMTGTSGIMGVGSGIVYDSVAEKEYQECRLKAAFLLETPPEFQLLETLLWDRQYTFLEEHLARVCASAEYFQIPVSRETIHESLNAAAQQFRTEVRYRVRLLVDRNGIPSIQSAEYSAPTSTKIAIAADRTRSGDLFLYHKTTHRPLYDEYRQRASNEGIADYIFLNERGEVTEGSITNIFIEKDARLISPPVSSGVLPGVYRRHMLKTDPRCVENNITLNDLRQADALYICNSLRGWCKVTLSE